MENVFNVKYNAEMDRLELPKQKLGEKAKKFIINHKFISTVVTTFLLLSLLNFYLIFSFMKVLESI